MSVCPSVHLSQAEAAITRHTYTVAQGLWFSDANDLSGISKCLPILLYGTEACPVNSAVRHSLQFALNRALLKIFGAFSKDTYQDICKYFGIWTVEEQICAHKSKYNLRYCASESAVCQTISKLRGLRKYNILRCVES